MKKLSIVSLFLLITILLSSFSYAAETTDSVDKDKFQYLIPYRFATASLTTNLTRVEIPISPVISASVIRNPNFYYAIHRGSTTGPALEAKVVGIVVEGSNACISGAATFDVTINGTQTGIRTVIEPAPNKSASGNYGSTGATYSYLQHDRNERYADKGFCKNSSSDDSRNWTALSPYGIATPMVAGNYVGVVVTTSDTFKTSGPESSANNYTVIIYVLE